MVVNERIFEQFMLQSSTYAQKFLSKQISNKTKQYWERMVFLMLSLALHAGTLLLFFKDPNPPNVLQPIAPIQVSLIKAEENISNVPVVKKEIIPQKAKKQNKAIFKKKLLVTDEPLEMTEPVSQIVEQVAVKDAEVEEPMQMAESEATEEEDVVPNPPVYEPPKFGVSYLNNPAPVYPAEAKRQKQQGVVMLRVLVKESGKPEQVEVSESAGVQSLDNAALNAVKKWTFIPAKIGSQVIPAYVIVPIRFNLERR